MARYMELSAELSKLVDKFMEQFVDDEFFDDAGVQMGHIINLAVRCNPRQPQGTVRRNIVGTAMKRFCDVHMSKEFDEKTGREYNKIHIKPKDGYSPNPLGG